MKRNIRGVFAPKILLPLLAVGAVGFGAVGIMSLLDRRGEAAISMIPADATMAMSFDNTPAASQVLLFNEISDAMEDSGLNRFVDEMISNEGVPPEARAIKDNLKGSFALGVWGNLASGKPDGLLAAALNNPGAAEGIVKKHGERIQGAPVAAYKFDEDVVIAFHKDYALIANSIKTIERAIDVSDGKVPSLVESPAYKKARESLPKEASLMVFVNGEAVANSDEDTKKMYEAFGIKEAGWAAFGATIKPEGIQLDMFQDMKDGGRIAEAYEAIGDLKYDSAGRLPAGAIGVAGVSDLGTMLKTVVECVEASELSGDVDQGMAEMEKDTGLSFEGDILPALAGETYAAIYPPKKAGEDPTFVLMFDEQNGATPEAAVRKLMAKVGEFTKSTLGEAEVFTSKEGKDEPVIAILPDQVVLTNDPALVATQSGSSLTANGGLAAFDDGEPAQFRIQIDMKKLFDVIREFGGDDMPALEQALSQQTLDCSWTVADGVARGRALIPFKVPELIRVLAKEAEKVNDAFHAEMAGPMGDMYSEKSAAELERDAKIIGTGLIMYAGDNGDKFPDHSQFLEGAVDKYLPDKEVRKDFLYMPPMSGGQAFKTEVGFFMAPEGRIVLYQDGHVIHEKFEE